MAGTAAVSCTCAQGQELALQMTSPHSSSSQTLKPVCITRLHRQSVARGRFLGCRRLSHLLLLLLLPSKLCSSTTWSRPAVAATACVCTVEAADGNA